MKLKHYFTLGLGLLAAVAISVPSFPAVETVGAAKSAVSSPPTDAAGLVKLALYKQAYCLEYTDDCAGDDVDNDDDGYDG
jgi:hypothetical protein